MTERAKALIERSHRALEASHRNLVAGDVETAVNRAYYAAFYITTALLLLEGIEPRTHTGLHHQFYQRFVTSGEFKPELSAILAKAAAMRQKTDYQYQQLPSSEEAEALLNDVGYFINTLHRRITSEP